jgi:hypothetical protein
MVPSPNVNVMVIDETAETLMPGTRLGPQLGIDPSQVLLPKRAFGPWKRRCAASETAVQIAERDSSSRVLLLY